MSTFLRDPASHALALICPPAVRSLIHVRSLLPVCKLSTNPSPQRNRKSRPFPPAWLWTLKTRHSTHCSNSTATHSSKNSVALILRAPSDHQPCAIAPLARRLSTARSRGVPQPEKGCAPLCAHLVNSRAPTPAINPKRNARPIAGCACKAIPATRPETSFSCDAVSDWQRNELPARD